MASIHIRLSAILHGSLLVVACENAPCDARRTRIRACDTHSLTSEPTHSRSPVACSAPNEVDAVLAGGRATPTANFCAGNRDKAPRRKCSQFPELINSAHLPTTHDIYEPTVYLCGESGRNCQVRLGAPSSPGDSRSHVGEPPATNPRRGITLAGLFLAGAGARSRYGARMMPQCSQWLCWLGGLVRLGENIEWAEVKFCIRAVGSTPGEDGAPTRT